MDVSISNIIFPPFYDWSSSPIIYSPTVNTPTRSAGDVNDVASIGEASTSESGENGEVSFLFSGYMYLKMI